jgi:hypothetical protein
MFHIGDLEVDVRRHAAKWCQEEECELVLLIMLTMMVGRD